MVYVPVFRKNPKPPPLSKKNEFIDNTIQPEIESQPKKILKGSGFAEVKPTPHITPAFSKKISDDKLKKFINLRL